MTSRVRSKKTIQLLFLLARILTLGTQPPGSEKAKAAPGRGPLGEKLIASTNLPAM